MNIFISKKTEKIAPSPYFNPYSLFIDDPSQPKSKENIDPSLIEMSISDLIGQLKIQDVQTFITIGRIMISRKMKKRKVSLIHQGKAIEFYLTKQEQMNVLFCKAKRKDELLKLGFKFIRRQILDEFQEKHKMKVQDPNKMTLKKAFYKNYFGEDQRAAEYFESFDISKKGYDILSNHTKLISKMKNFCSSKFIEDMIKHYILEKSSDVVKKEMNIKEFFVELLSRQHKHSVTIQAIINSQEQIFDFFKN